MTDDDFVIALVGLCIELAPDLPALNRWGRQHAALIDAQPDEIFHPVRARFAARRAELHPGAPK